MPHVTVSLWPGKSDEQKQRLSDAIVECVTKIVNYGEGSVSVDFDEVNPDHWMDQIYEPKIAGRWATLTKKPGYGPGQKG